MNWIEMIQTVILIALLDRQLIIRDRYKFAFSINKPSDYVRGYIYFGILCRKGQDQHYMREGGRKIFRFEFGKALKK